ncbi:MAG: Rieske 2Fe-2S domain-containing protein [Planctomycetes bacterium]|nr:Rieske 2Fe-2S domain-containing protein [Planctomycetota bacterium]
MSHTATVRFGKMFIVGRFRTERPELKPRDKCVVRSDRGRELAEVLTPLEAVADPATVEGVPEILRRATPDDLKLAATLEREHRVRELKFCREEIARLNLRMKLVEADHILGGERIIFYFVSETRVDFRELVRRLAHEFRTRIELKQVGARDQARLVGDVGHCGLSLCCRGWIKDLGGITMDMAKIQKHTADPSKITGRCGKLLCCLRYEYAWYLEGRDLLPPRGTRIETRIGTGVVVDQNLLLREVTIEKEGNERKVVKLSEIAGAPATQPGCTGCDSPRTGEHLDTTVARRLEQDTKILPPAPEPPQFRKMTTLAELPPGTSKEFHIGSFTVALFNIAGAVHAVQGDCPHQGGPIADGTLDGTVVTCPWHQWTFDVTTGSCLSVTGSVLRRYEVRIEGEDVWVKA